MTRRTGSLEAMGSGGEPGVVAGRVFDIQRYSTKDGPGVRTTIFLKGCPLRCHWCSNPESQAKRTELIFNPNRCVGCYSCIDVCPNGANRLGPRGDVILDRTLCRVCGACAEVCQGKARLVSGKLMTPEDVMKVVRKDTLFFRNSGGGITLSGGEPTQQPEFATALLRSCKHAGFHTTLDTCGYCGPENLQTILEYVDLVLFDLKHMDADRHEELTGVSNELILENARRTAQAGIQMIIRFPVIPGCNDSMDNISQLGEFVSDLGVRRFDLLPYHKFAQQKYDGLNLDYRLRDTAPPPEKEIRDIKVALESFGLDVSVVV